MDEVPLWMAVREEDCVHSNGSVSDLNKGGAERNGGTRTVHKLPHNIWIESRDRN